MACAFVLPGPVGKKSEGTDSEKRPRHAVLCRAVHWAAPGFGTLRGRGSPPRSLPRCCFSTCCARRSAPGRGRNSRSACQQRDAGGGGHGWGGRGSQPRPRLAPIRLQVPWPIKATQVSSAARGRHPLGGGLPCTGHAAASQRGNTCKHTHANACIWPEWAGCTGHCMQCATTVIAHAWVLRCTAMYGPCFTP